MKFSKFRAVLLLVLIGLFLTSIILSSHTLRTLKAIHELPTKDSSNDYFNYYCNKYGCDGFNNTGIFVQVNDSKINKSSGISLYYLNNSSLGDLNETLH